MDEELLVTPGDAPWRETLRAELLAMELRLTKWVASAESVKSLEQRVSHLESSRVAREHLANDLVAVEEKLRVLENDSVGRKAIRNFGLAVVGVVTVVNAVAGTLLVYFN